MLWGGGGRGKEGEVDRQDERMGGCDAKYTHLSTPRARSLLCDSPSVGQAELKKHYERAVLNAMRTFSKLLCFIEYINTLIFGVFKIYNIL